MNEDRTVIMAIEVIPLDLEAYRIVDEAIAVIARSGVRYQVGPMETTMQGNLDRLLEVAKAAHLAAFKAGAQKVVTLLKIGDAVEGASIDKNLEKYST